MITAQVFERITPSELARIATACGFSTEVERDGGKVYVWINMGQRTVIAVVADDGEFFVMVTVLASLSISSAKINEFNRGASGWTRSYTDDKGNAVLSMPHLVTGVTRDNIAMALFLFKAALEEFLRRFEP
jgi:hypothetical protein